MKPKAEKRCSRCRKTKPAKEFAWRRKEKGQRDSHCRPCRSAYGKEHYARNRQKYIDAEARRKKARTEKRMRLLIDYLMEHPCVDCGESDPMVLEFDHLEDKKFCISNQFASRNWESILEEIEKCDVVCANCHRRRTARRAGFARALLADLMNGEPIIAPDAGEV